MEIKDLKEGDVFYDADLSGTRKLKYVKCFRSNPENHVILNETGYPKRINGSSLKLILNKNLNTYQEALDYFIDALEEQLKFWKHKRNEL